MLHFKIDHDAGGAERATTLAHVVACPNCHAELTAVRSGFPAIDSCGFESYRMECEECGAQLAGIIDPADEALLLSVIED